MSKTDDLIQRLHRIEMEKARLKAEISRASRRADVKRKIFYGIAALRLAQDDEKVRTQLLHILEAVVTRPSDRALFGFTCGEECVDD